MAGSLKWFIYTTDSGDTFALKADESNVEELMGATGDFLADTEITFSLPSNIKPRSATYSSASRYRNITIPVLTAAVYAALETDNLTIVDPIAGSGNLTLVRKTPERITMLPVGEDTGLIDGDAT